LLFFFLGMRPIVNAPPFSLEEVFDVPSFMMGGD
jgi:hypothetical protein